MTTAVKPKAHLNIVAIGLRLLLQIIGWILLSWLLAQLVLLITTAWWGHELTLFNREQLLSYELHRFLWQTASLSRLQGIAQWDMTIIHALQQLAQAIPSPYKMDNYSHYAAIQMLWYTLYPPLADFARSSLIVTQIVLLRITRVFLFVPLIVLLEIVGLCNGLVQRALRRLNGGRESSLLYHYTKAAIKPCLFWGSLLYVVLPFSLNAFAFMLPCAMGSGAAIFFAAKTFKKYS